jgi:hypothetical protein
MAGDEYFIGLLHRRSEDCGLPFSFLRRCAIQFIGQVDDIVQPRERFVPRGAPWMHTCPVPPTKFDLPAQPSEEGPNSAK